MKIAIDISQIVYKGSGVSRYTRNLIEALLTADKKNQYIFFFSSLRQKLNHAIEKKINVSHVIKKYPFPPTLLDFLWNRLHVFPIDKLVGKTDLVFTSDWTEPPSCAKKITVIHDLVFLKFPETLPQKIIDVQKRRLHWVKKESELIIADSQSTKADLINLQNIPPEKIEVVYPAINTIIPKEDAMQHTLKKYNLKKPFILTVGKLEPRKNLSRLLQAFSNTDLIDLDLVIVGQKGWGDNDERSMIKEKNANQIQFLGFIPDHDLYSLYKSALFFVYPSLYEGFGYPVVEAMNLGCPVATSNTSSLKEIGQDATLLFNPYNKEEISRSLVNLSRNQHLREGLKEKGLRRSLHFSQRRFAKNLLQVYEKVYDHRR